MFLEGEAWWDICKKFVTCSKEQCPYFLIVFLIRNEVFLQHVIAFFFLSS